jgi:hypothetical protein
LITVEIFVSEAVVPTLAFTLTSIGVDLSTAKPNAMTFLLSSETEIEAVVLVVEATSIGTKKSVFAFAICTTYVTTVGVPKSTACQAKVVAVLLAVFLSNSMDDPVSGVKNANSAAGAFKNNKFSSFWQEAKVKTAITAVKILYIFFIFQLIYKVIDF